MGGLKDEKKKRGGIQNEKIELLKKLVTKVTFIPFSIFSNVFTYGAINKIAESAKTAENLIAASNKN